MTDFVDRLERELVGAARRRNAGRARALQPTRPPRATVRTMLLAAVILIVSAGSAAAGTLLALRGSVIPAPEAVPPEQTPAPGTSHISALRAADPAHGVPPWTLRVARSETGLLCSTVGQIQDGRFGLVGMDGRFRTISEGVSDSCGSERHGAASLIGARVFDARHRADVRTVVSGVAGADLRSVVVDAGGRARRPPIGPGGTFLVPLRGYPEDLAIRATLRFASGRREVHDFGRSPWVVVDPAGGPAWRALAFRTSSDRRSCVSFQPARQRPGAPVSPAACGDLGEGRHPHGLFFAVRRITPGTGGVPVGLTDEGSWGAHPARTAVWGAAGEDVAAIRVQRAGQPPRRLTITPGSRTFLAVFGPRVDPATLTVRVRLRSGRIEVLRGSTGLVDHPLPSRFGSRTRRTP